MRNSLHALPAPRLPRAAGPVARPVSSAPRRSGFVLLFQAGRVLAEAAEADTAGERFRLAHLAALRGAAAVFAERTRPNERRRPTNAWVLLTSVAPELADWAAYFSAGAADRAALEAGAVDVVSQRRADDLLRATGQFLAIVESMVGVLAAAG